MVVPRVCMDLGAVLATNAATDQGFLKIIPGKRGA
jgi:hypothetical protein